MKPPKSLHCPVCRQPLAGQPFIDWPVQVCAGCRGLWLPETTLNKIVRVKRNLPQPLPPHSPLAAFAAAMQEPLHTRPRPERPCPQCGKAMQTQIYRGSGVPVDQCYPCMSLFLDAGELPLIYEFTHSAKRAARRAEIEKLFEDHAKRREKELRDKLQGRDITPGKGLHSSMLL